MATDDESPNVTRLSAETLDATERRQAEEALPESETILADIAGSLKEVVWSASPNTLETLYLNSVAEAVYGRPVAEFLANTHLWFEVIHPEDKERVARHVQESLKDGSTELEYRILRPDGEVRWLHGQAHLARDTSGHATRIVGITTDITERKRAEEALRESLGLLQAVIEGATDPIFVKDADGRYVMLNSEALRLVGFSAAELVGKDDTAVFPPDEARQLMEDDRKVMESGVPRTLEDVVTVAGVERTYLARKRVWRDPDGKVIGLIGVATDITERKRMEEALRESEERFRSAFEHAAIGMVLVRTDGRFLQINQSMCEMLGYSEQELLATNFQAITNPEDLNTGLGYMRQVLTGEINSCQFEKRYFHKLGHEVWALLSFSLVRDADGSPLYFIAQVQDISERKLAEEQLQVAREDLEGRVERQLLRRNPYGLTFRELTALNLVAAGKSDKEIGIDLGISPLTARKHLSNILTKMDVASRTEAVARGLREGLLD